MRCNVSGKVTADGVVSKRWCDGMRRVLAVLMAAVLCVCMMPVGVFAAGRGVGSSRAAGLGGESSKAAVPGRKLLEAAGSEQAADLGCELPNAVGLEQTDGSDMTFKAGSDIDNGSGMALNSASGGDDVEITTEEVSYRSGTYDTDVVETNALFSHTDPTSEIDFDPESLKTPDDAMPLSCDPKVYDAFGFDSDELTDAVCDIQNEDSYKDPMAGFSYMDPNEFVVASDNHMDNHYNIIRVNDNVQTSDVSTLPDNIGMWSTNSNTPTEWTESKDYQTHNVTGADFNGDGIDEAMVYLSLRADGTAGGNLDIDILTKYTDDGSRWLWENAEDKEDSRYTEHLSDGKEILDIKASEAKSYTAITAGDFDGDGGEELAFYAAAKEKDDNGIKARVCILKVTADSSKPRAYTFSKISEVYLRDIAPDTADMDKDWHLPVVSLQTTRTRLGGKDDHNSKSVTHYNVYEDLVINISTPNISSYDDLNNDSFTAIYGRKTESSTAIEQLWKTEHAPFEVEAGKYARMSAVNTCDADINGDGFDEIVAAGVSEEAKGDSLKEAGGYDEDTNFVTVISNTKGAYGLTWSTPKAVEAAEYLDPDNFGSLEPIALCAGHFDGSTGQSFDQVCIEGVIFAAAGTKLTGTPSYAESDGQGSCTYAVISDTDPDNNAENLPESGVTFNKLYAFDISNTSNPKHHPWIDTAIAGHFCSESDVDSIALISNDTGSGVDHIYMDITMLSYYQDPDATQGGQWKYITHNDYIHKSDEDDNGTSLAICFMDAEADSFHYRYRGTYAAYTAPKLYTVVQAQPFYEEVNDADTKFTISTGVGFDTDAMLGLLLQGEISVPTGIPGVRIGVNGELNFSYTFMASKTKTATQTFQFYSDRDYALVYTVPEVVNSYDLIVDATGEYTQYNTFQPLSPEFAALSLDDYNAALSTPSSDEYLPASTSAYPVTSDMIPASTPGDPLGYGHSLDDIIGKNSIDDRDMTTIAVESTVNSTSEKVENTLEFEDTSSGTLGAAAELTVHLKCCTVTDLGIGANGEVTGGKSKTGGSSYTLYYDGIPKELEYGISFDPLASAYNDQTAIVHYSPSSGCYDYNSTAVAYRLSDRYEGFADESVIALSFYTTNVQKTPEQPDQFSRKSIRKNYDGSADISFSWVSQQKNGDRVPDGYNLYIADINTNLSTVHLVNREGMIPRAATKYTTYNVHLDANNYSDRSVFYLTPVFAEDDGTKKQVTEGAVDRTVTVNITAQTSGNVLITGQPSSVTVKDDGKDETVTMSCSARKDDSVFLTNEKMWFYWMMEDEKGEWNILQTDSFEVTGAGDVSPKKSTLKLDVPGTSKDSYVEMPIVCRVAYGNYSVTSDGVLIRYTEPAVTAVSLKSVKRAGSKKLKVTWKRTRDAEGYQLQYKAPRSKWKTIDIKNKTRKTYTIKNLKRGKKYAVRIRAFRKYSGRRIYSKWSKKKTMKVK
ncbi:MAG: fibronectin type III domain-containing protein [Eubacterium sp.]|nr:fibronectin type III domain-containing protein [Eubacterium sp.]